MYVFLWLWHLTVDCSESAGLWSCVCIPRAKPRCRTNCSQPSATRIFATVCYMAWFLPCQEVHTPITAVVWEANSLIIARFARQPFCTRFYQNSLRICKANKCNKLLRLYPPRWHYIRNRNRAKQRNRCGESNARYHNNAGLPVTALDKRDADRTPCKTTIRFQEPF